MVVAVAVEAQEDDVLRDYFAQSDADRKLNRDLFVALQPLGRLEREMVLGIVQTYARTALAARRPQLRLVS